MDAKQIHLVVFLSRSTSLDRWNESGILERELGYYRELKNHLGGISLLSPGGNQDLQYRSELGKITLLNNRWHLPPNVFSLCAPLLHGSVLRSADVFKTNQLDGAWTAVIARRLYHKPVIVRAGYLWSEFVWRDRGGGLKTHTIAALERFSLKAADALFVTAGTMRVRMANDFGIEEKKITVVPNYVDTGLFRPQPDRQIVPGRICFIGRLHPQKNLKELILAVSQIPGCSLIIVGEGNQRKDLSKLASEYRVEVEFTGVIKHSELPALINACQIFILPSLYEGHPKALIEAMACGVPVVGTDVPGIKELIINGKTGLISNPDHESLRDTIQALMSDLSLQESLGENARSFAVENFSLPKIIGLELSAINSMFDWYERS